MNQIHGGTPPSVSQRPNRRVSPLARLLGVPLWCLALSTAGACAVHLHDEVPTGPLATPPAKPLELCYDESEEGDPCDPNEATVPPSNPRSGDRPTVDKTCRCRCVDDQVDCTGM